MQDKETKGSAAYDDAREEAAQVHDGAQNGAQSDPVCRENGNADESTAPGAPAARTPDLFDRMFTWRFLRPFAPLFARHREGLLYLFFGGLTTAVSWGSFYLFCYPLSLGELLSEALSWAAAVLFAFLTNRAFVFRATDRPFWRALGLFAAARLFTLALGEGLLYLFTTRMGCEPMAVKILSELFTLLLNYIFSKILVFRRPR